MTMTLKMQKFCEEYSLTGNATKAAILAGYSPNSAAQTGSRLLNKVEVENYVRKLQEDRRRQFVMSEDEILQEITGIVKAENTKVKDKLRALDLLAKLLGLKVGQAADRSREVIILDDIPTSGRDY